MSGGEPLIVTARFDDGSFSALDALRRRHFPAALNKVPAHLTLFHHLPGGEAEAVAAFLADRCRAIAPFDLRPAGLRFLGRGVALAYDSPELAALHGACAAAWQAWLTPQDRQPFKAHVTVQNKADPATARALRDDLGRAPAQPCRVDGVMLWRYLGGPWAPVAAIAFAGPLRGGG